MPEVSLVAVLDADKEGFLRSEGSLIQTIGRAARNVRGKAILYADKITGSMERAISETGRRRARQTEHNKENGITPKTINKKIADVMEGARSKVSAKAKNKKKSASVRPIALTDNPKALGKRIKDLEKKMYQH